MLKERHKIVPASYLVLIKDNKILLLRRFNTGYEDGKYSMVAGHVNAGESFAQCIVREAFEEAGTILNLKDLKVAHVMQRKTTEKENNERVDVFFTAEKWGGEVANKETQKCDDLSWFDLNNIPDNTIPYVKQAIDCIKNKIFYSEQGYNIKI